MKYLLDTCILSEVQQKTPNLALLAYVRRLDPGKTFISAVTIGELSKGIHFLEAGKRRTQLEDWLSGIEEGYAGKIRSVTADVARIWGELLANAKKQGIGISVIDALITATAIHHGLHLVTRNVSDFKVTGVLLINPWDAGAG